MPSRFKYGLIYFATALSLVHSNPATFQHHYMLRKHLPGLKYLIHLLSINYFTSSLASNTNYSLTTAQLNAFVDVRDKYAVYSSSFNTHASNCTGVLDNSANVHVLKDKLLFTSKSIDCPVVVDVGTVIGTNYLSGIGTAEIKWYDNYNVEYSTLLHDALYYLDSPINVISVTKLGIDNEDDKLNI